MTQSEPPNKLTVATNVVAAVVMIFMLGYVANGVGQFQTTGTYVLPTDLVDLIKLVFGAAITCLTLAALLGNRKARNDDDGE